MFPGGFISPTLLSETTLAPAQRLDLWVDFSERSVGEQMRLVNLPSAAPDGGGLFPILTVQIDREESVFMQLPESLSVLNLRSETDSVNHRSPREFTLAMGRGMNWTINGRTFQMMATSRDEIVKLDDLEIWQFENRGGSGMGMMGGGQKKLLRK